ncbi:MAG: alpha/beta hydrolase family protein [Candidatus Coatesbacteria bacterium]
MAVTEIHFSADNAIGRMNAATVLLPERREGPFPVLYLLHGWSDDHTAWARRTSLERYVGGLPLIVVMPDGEHGSYVDAPRPRAGFETLIVRDLIGWVDRTFRTIPRREGRVIEGLSMGGYGAAKLALKYPDMFCAVAAHSGSVAKASLPRFLPPARRRELAPMFGEHPIGGPDDVFALAARCPRHKLPAIRLDCGKDDYLLEQNRALHRHLAKLRIPHEYAEPPGAHTWEYWDRQVQEALDFFCRVLKLGRT